MSEINQPVTEPPIVRRTSGGRKLLAFVLALMIFVCGGATGFGVAMMHHRPPPQGFGMMPDPPVDDLVNRLRDELLLSDDQVKQVRQIYQDRRDALESIRHEMDPKLKAEYDKLDVQMKGVLNSMQYQRWSERFRSVRDRMLPPPPHGGRMGPGGPMGPGDMIYDASGRPVNGGPMGPDGGPGPHDGPAPHGGPPDRGPGPGDGLPPGPPPGGG